MYVTELRETITVTEHTYVYSGGLLMQEVIKTTTGTGENATVTTDTLNYFYDASGLPLTVTYNGTLYYYATNLQGDVVALVNTSGTAVVNYTYDAWGNILTTNGVYAASLGEYNALKYRGYVYDTETEFYYLQSRYYNPEIGRFINADAFAATGQDLLGNNMFTYCLNNPVNMTDPSGKCALFGPLVDLIDYIFLIFNFVCQQLTDEENIGKYPAIPPGGITVHEGSINICTDGSAGDKIPDDYWQPYTAYSQWTDSTATVIDAYTMPYIVMPISEAERYGAQLGDRALVINQETGQSIWCVIGEEGPAWGEVSIYVVWEIDNPNHLTANHASGLSDSYKIIIYPGKSFDFDWSYGIRVIYR